MARPRPRLPPVTMTLRMRARQFAGRGHVELRNEAHQDRDLVLREFARGRSAGSLSSRTAWSGSAAGPGAPSSSRTTSATTIEPVIGLALALTSDMLTRGSAG